MRNSGLSRKLAKPVVEQDQHVAVKVGILTIAERDALYRNGNRDVAVAGYDLDGDIHSTVVIEVADDQRTGSAEDSVSQSAARPGAR